MDAFRRTILLSLLPSLAPTVAAADAEAIFAEAAAYTLRIDTTVQLPFIEDERGAHFGAAFLVDKDRGWAITNAHVAARSPARLEAILNDGRRFGAERVYVDPYIDVAVLKLGGDVSGLQEAELSCGPLPGVGHPVGAYGHPWGFDFTGTRGVVSGSTYELGPEMIQTDTPINGGNSGGPLISLKTGEVVGVNQAKYASSEDQNTNFAVPVRQVCRILELLQDGRDPSPARLDTVFYQVRGAQNRLTVARTFLDEQLLSLQAEDQILAVNGMPVDTESELLHELRGSLNSVVLSISRDGEDMELLGRLSPTSLILERQGLYFAGILFADSGFRDWGSVDAGPGIMVHSLLGGTDADGEGLIPFDYLVRVDGIEIRSLEQLRLLLANEPASGEIQLDFMRLIEDEGSGHLFYSVRRNTPWSESILVGAWDSLGEDMLQSREH
jgi:S1-C subfamily serine protease